MSEYCADFEGQTAMCQLHPFYAYQYELIFKQSKHFALDDFSYPSETHIQPRLSEQIYPVTSSFEHQAQEVADRYMKIYICREGDWKLGFFALYRLKFVQLTEMGPIEKFMLPILLFEDPEIQVFLVIREGFNWYIRKVDFPETSFVIPGTTVRLKMRMWDYNKQQLFSYESSLEVELRYDSLFYSEPFKFIASFGPNEGDIRLADVMNEDCAQDLFERQMQHHFKSELLSLSAELETTILSLDIDYKDVAHNLPNFWVELGYQHAFTVKHRFVNYYYVHIDTLATVYLKDAYGGTVPPCIEYNGRMVESISCEFETVVIHIPMGIISEHPLILCVDSGDECYEKPLNCFKHNGIELQLPLMFEGQVSPECSIQLDSTVLTANFSLHSYYETIWNILQLLNNAKDTVTYQDLQISKEIIKELVDILRERVASKPIEELLQNVAVHIEILFHILRQVSQNDERYEEQIKELLGDRSYKIAGDGDSEETSEENSELPGRRIIFSIILIVFEFAQEYCRNISITEEQFEEFTYFRYQTEVLNDDHLEKSFIPCLGYKFEQSFDNSTIGRIVSNMIVLDQEFTELYISGLDQQLLRNIRMLKSGAYYLDILHLSLASGNIIEFEQAHSLFVTLGEELTLFAGILAEKFLIKRQNIRVDMMQMVGVSSSLYKVFKHCGSIMNSGEAGNLFRGFLFELQFVDTTDEESIELLTGQIIAKCAIIPFLIEFLIDGRYINRIEDFVTDEIDQCLGCELSQNAPEIAVLFYFYYQFLEDNKPQHVSVLFERLTDNIEQFLQIPETMDQEQWEVVQRTFFAVYLEMLWEQMDERVTMLLAALETKNLSVEYFVTRMFELFDFSGAIRRDNATYYEYYQFGKRYLALRSLNSPTTLGDALERLFVSTDCGSDILWDNEFVEDVEDRMRERLLQVMQQLIHGGGLHLWEVITILQKIKLTAQTEPPALAALQDLIIENSPEAEIIRASFSIDWKQSGQHFAIYTLDNLISKWQSDAFDEEEATNLLICNCGPRNLEIVKKAFEGISRESTYKDSLLARVNHVINERDLSINTEKTLELPEPTTLNFDEYVGRMLIVAQSTGQYALLEQLTITLERHENYLEASNVNQAEIEICINSMKPWTEFQRQLDQTIEGSFLSFQIKGIEEKVSIDELVVLVQRQFNLLTLAQNLELASEYLQVLLNNNQEIRAYNANEYRETLQLLEQQRKQVVVEQLYSTRQFGYFYRVRFCGPQFAQLDEQTQVFSRSIAHRCFDVQKELSDFYVPRVPGVEISTHFSPQLPPTIPHIQLFSLLSYIPEHFKNSIFEELNAQIFDVCKKFKVSLPELCENPAKLFFRQQLFYSERHEQEGVFPSRILRFTLCSHQLPALTTSCEVVYEFTYELTPVQSAVLEFAEQLYQVKREIQLHQLYALTDLQMTLQGVAAANVNGGPIYLTEELIESGKFGERDISYLVKELKLLTDATGDLLKLCDQIPKHLEEFESMLQKAVGILRGKANVLWDEFRGEPV